MSDTKAAVTAATHHEPVTWERLKRDRNWLGFWFMMPAMGFLLLFLAYPLILAHAPLAG